MIAVAAPYYDSYISLIVLIISKDSSKNLYIMESSTSTKPKAILWFFFLNIAMQGFPSLKVGAGPVA